MSATSETPVAERQILLLGPYGVLGTGVIDAVAENRKWAVTTAARRPAPAYRARAAPPHISVDLMDREGTTMAFSALDKVTDLVFAAYVEKPTMAETVEPNARMLKNALDALAARNVPLQRIILAGGAKSYGFSLGSFNAPAKETQPCLIAPIHYHQQEDIVADWAAKNGASWTVLRPHLVMGPSLNSPMNLVTSLATYAAMSRELGLPLRFPGTKEGWNTLQETTDAELFGRATLWALGEDKARNEIFNVSNGDVYRWRHLWNELAAFYDLPIGEPLAMSTVSEMSEKASLWDSMVARYGLHPTPYNQIANWAFVDWMLNFREETIQSTIKIRQAGFADCIDTHESFRRQLTRLRDLRMIPAPVSAPDVHIVANSNLVWSDFMPAGFDPGMKLAVLNGDPGKTGDYAVRLQFPGGYRFPVHWHPSAENLTVVSGTFQLGMGDATNGNALRTYAPGDYIYIPPRHAHFGGNAAQGPSVIQLHGEGPFQVMLGAPK